MKCTDITKVDNLPEVGDLLKVTFDDGAEALWFYPQAESLQYVNQEVYVEFRQDIYRGELKQFIATLVIPRVIQTLDKHESFKLYIDQRDEYSNVSFREMKIGETMYGAKVFCVKNEYKTSSRAVWMEMLIRDMFMHVATLRIFDPTSTEIDFAGRYIFANITKTAYGFQTKDKIADLNIDSTPNAEVALAEEFIKNYFADDAAALQYMNRTNIIQSMKALIDYEPGYALMRLAMHLSIIESMDNVSNDVDLRAISDAMLCSYGYCTRTSIMSHSFINVSLAANDSWKNRNLVLQLLDDALEEKPKEFEVYRSVVDLVNTILEIRKGTGE